MALNNPLSAYVYLAHGDSVIKPGSKHNSIEMQPLPPVVAKPLLGNFLSARSNAVVSWQKSTSDASRKQLMSLCLWTRRGSDHWVLITFRLAFPQPLWILSISWPLNSTGCFWGTKRSMNDQWMGAGNICPQVFALWLVVTLDTSNCKLLVCTRCSMCIRCIRKADDAILDLGFGTCLRKSLQ